MIKVPEESKTTLAREMRTRQIKYINIKKKTFLSLKKYFKKIKKVFNGL